MLTPAKRKEMISVIIGTAKPKSGEGASAPKSAPSMPSMDDEEDESGTMGMHSAAESLISAIGSKDVAGVADALQSFMDCAKGSYSDESDEG